MTIANLIAALPGGSAAIDQLLLRAALIGGYAHFIQPDIDPQTVNAVDPQSGAAPWLIEWQEKHWWKNPADDTTDHDGITCIVTEDGGRYFVNTVDPWHGYGVKSATLTDPPDPEDEDEEARPQFGQAWLVPAGSSGAWAGHPDEIAIWTSRQWYYVPPRKWRTVGVDDEGGYRHWDGTEWVQGFGNSTFADASIAPAKLVQGLKFWIVQSMEQEEEPPIAKGVNYVVGADPEGDLVGHSGQILTSDDGLTRKFYAPSEGWEAYDVDTNTAYRFNGAAWVPQQGAVVHFDSKFTAGTGSSANAGSGSNTYSDTTAPTTAQEHWEDQVTISHAARKTGAKLRFNYSARSNTSGGDGAVLGLFRDSEVNAIAWVQLTTANATQVFNHMFVVEAPDTAPHVYSIRKVRVATAPAASSRRLFTLEEFA
jgi:hypothetical protein